MSSSEYRIDRNTALCMDASGLLRRQGWLGDGHSLHHTGKGIKKPLLVSKKVDVLGVGLNKHAAVSDQWWLRAYDQGLKDFGSGKENLLGQVQKHGIGRGRLYGRFVKGEAVPGTIGTSLSSTPVGSITPVEVVEEAAEKMPDLKRKRAERPEEKRARRKLERQERSRVQQEGKSKGVDDGTAEINRRANEFVLEAQRRGLIPAGPNEIRKGLVPTGANATAVSADPNDTLAKLMDTPKMHETRKRANKGSEKERKYGREGMKRELKRAVKAYLGGTKPRSEMTKEERQASKEEKRIKREKKEAQAAAAAAEKAAKQAARAERKKELRAQRVAEREEAEKNGEVSEVPAKGRKITPVTAKQGPATVGVVGDDFSAGIDEVKLGVDTIGGMQKGKAPAAAEVTQSQLPVDLRSTTEIEKDKIDLYRAVKHGLTLQDYRRALAKGEVQVPGVEKKDLSEEKLQKYTRRAQEKGVSVEEYIKRREEKYAAKQAEKLGSLASARGLVEATAAPTAPAVGDASTTAGELGFIVDTAGDAALGRPPPSTPLTTKKASRQDPEFANALALIAEGKPVTILDESGTETFRWEPNTHVPLDQRLWAGVVVKQLPKIVRKARKEWMAVRREERKRGAGKPLAPKKPKGQRKVEARESFVYKILRESRDFASNNGGGGGGKAGETKVEVDGVPEVSLVKVETRDGTMFSKAEVSAARTVARRVMRDVKRRERAERGKGKGYKKLGVGKRGRPKSKLGSRK